MFAKWHICMFTTEQRSVRDRNTSGFRHGLEKYIVVVFESLENIKLQPAIFPLSKHVFRFHELPAVTMHRIFNTIWLS